MPDIDLGREVYSLRSKRVGRIGTTCRSGNMLTYRVDYPDGECEQHAEHELMRQQDKEIAEQYSIKEFYHITSIDNMHSILSRGLLSRRSLQGTSTPFKDISDPNVQQIRASLVAPLSGTLSKIEIHECVPVFFTSRTPMLYKVQIENQPTGLVIIAISPHYVLAREWCFYNGNAASGYSESYTDLHKLDTLNWEVIRAGSWGFDYVRKRQISAEFLVKPNLPPQSFDRLIVYDQQTMQRLEAIVKTADISTHIEVDRSCFF